MDDKSVRAWGLIGGGGALAVALAVANSSDPDRAAPSYAKAGNGPPPAVEFIIRFKEGHPLAKAQDLSAQGKRAEAEALARKVLSRSGELSGLCFENFTLGGTEIVLSICEDPPAAARADASARWTGKLKALPGVQYADANVVMQPDRGE